MVYTTPKNEPVYIGVVSAEDLKGRRGRLLQPRNLCTNRSSMKKETTKGNTALVGSETYKATSYVCQ